MLQHEKGASGRRSVNTAGTKSNAKKVNRLAHNHPSGNLTPSRQDEELTAKIKEACRVMDIQLADHIILSPVGGKYLSFADEGLI
jgi:DNA repair protein RadC